MIKSYNLIPQNYIKYSRDMQIITKVFDIIFNHVKTNIDLATKDTKNINSSQNLIDLTCKTLGFNQTHSYNIEQLTALCTTFREAIRNKGSLKGIELILELISEVEDSEEIATVQVDQDTPYQLVISIPSTIKDLTLFYDVMEYIIPSGVSYVVTHTLDMESQITTNLNIHNESTIKARTYVPSGATLTRNITSDYLIDQIPNPDNFDHNEIIINSTTKDSEAYQNNIVKIPTTNAEENILNDSLTNTPTYIAKEYKEDSDNS